MKDSLPRSWSRHRASLLRLDHSPARFPIHVTLGTHRNETVLSSPPIGQLVFRILKTHERTLAAVVMPDHVHWLLDDSEKAPRAVADFKSLSTHLVWDRGHTGELWQRSYYDHVVRDSESLKATVKDLLANPIRSGLALRVDEYTWTYDRFGLSDSCRDSA